MSNEKKKIIITNLIDWSQSFVDDYGTFYCGTTQEQKNNALRLLKVTDLAIYSTDLHPLEAKEFSINGGIYPIHNIPTDGCEKQVLPFKYSSDFIYHKNSSNDEFPIGIKTVSPMLTPYLERYMEENFCRGIIMPKNVYYQNGSTPCFNNYQIEATFNGNIINPKDFIEKSHYNYIIAPKRYFDATRLNSNLNLPKTNKKGIPATDFNVFSLIKKRYPESKYELIFVNTGVVESICVLNTAMGIKQMFSNDTVVTINDAVTPLLGLGFDNKWQSREACTKICEGVGIEYMTTDRFIDLYTNM